MLVRRPTAGLCALLLAIWILGGCASADAAGTVRIDIEYSHFQPDAVTVPVGRPVQFLLSNADPIVHEWIVGDAALHERHRTGTEPAHGDRPTEQTIPALGFVRTTVTFDVAGTYQYICHLPGHEAYGMVGTVIVTGSSVVPGS